MRLPRIIWYLFTKLLVSLSEIGIPFFLWSCNHVGLIRKYARSYRALELLYTYSPKKISPFSRASNINNSLIVSRGIKEAFFTKFWEKNVDNAQEVRDRLVLVKKELREAISNQRKSSYQDIRILSVGSGSARGVLEVLAEDDMNRVRVTLIDISRSALRFSEKLAESLQVKEKIETHRVDISQFLAETDKRFHIIEMVGLAEYLEEEVLISVLEGLWRVLIPGGTVILSHVAPNREMDFLSVIVGWVMIYRNKEEIEIIIANTPFKRIERYVPTPLDIHYLYIVTKT